MNLQIIFRYVIGQFSYILDIAEQIRKYQLVDSEPRGPERIIFETALEYSNIGAKSELDGIACQENYKNSYLLLQILVQPFIVDRKIDGYEERWVSYLLDLVSQRISQIEEAKLNK